MSYILNKQLNAIYDDLEIVDGRSQQNEPDIDANDSSLTTLQTDVAGINSNITTIQGNISTIDSSLGVLQTDVVNNRSDITALQTINSSKVYGIRYQASGGVQTYGLNTEIPFSTVQYAINIEPSEYYTHGWKITSSGFYQFGYTIENYGDLTAQGGVLIDRRSSSGAVSLAYVSGPTRSISENISIMQYLDAGDELRVKVWANSIVINSGLGRRQFWIHSV